ncbi:MAG: GNAT family N-acetyltransferase [Candidatus Dormibacteraeota bacterium]|uniref:GNAT family N-acetyltransferase n=1 Tax=Candidatus Aeolococcus gillhamiae TaxID=3127015 RepID=A0A934K1D6_9BACT|nr:GNAT family N-acetyltransferase [Candidatus Dormibacteraeota bacterium]
MTTTVCVRPVRPGEYEEAGAVTALAYGDFMPPVRDSGMYEKRLADVAGRATRALVLVADLDGTIAATATLELDQRINPDSQQPLLEADEAHLRMLGVHPDHRRRGIGRLLVDACIEHAREWGKRRLTLDTTERMVGARALYEGMGFRFRGYSDRIPEVLILMYEREVTADLPCLQDPCR